MNFEAMYDLYKGSDHFDLSVPESTNHVPYMAEQQNNYSSYEPNGSRPNSGSETYTELSSMGPREATHTMAQQQQQHSHPHPQQPSMYQMGVSGVMHDGAPQFPPQNMYMPPISQQAQMLAAQSNGYMGHSSQIYTNAGLGMPHPQGGHPMMGSNPMMQQSLYYQRPQMPSTSGSPTSGGSPSPGSEDSDDSNAQAQGRGKRPSHDVIAEPGPVKGKKARVSKKNKKKKDPNEPQKPVSAYALFFRDTQSAIKTQNPNASFGEISKIVASMWDSLDPDRKSMYKKKTEVAKKEYLKLLAAYRASLVSKGEGDPGMYGAGPTYSQLGSNPPFGYPSVSNSGAMPHPQGHSPPQMSPLAKKSPLMNSMMGPESSSLMSPPMSQPMPASAPGMMPHAPMSGMNPSTIAQQMNSAQMSHQQMIPPHMGQMTPVPSSSPYMTQPNPLLSSPVSSMGSDVGSPSTHTMHTSSQQQQQQQQQPPLNPPTSQSQQPQTQQQQSPEQQGNASSHPAPGPNQLSPNQPSGQIGQNGSGPCSMGSCTRVGCTNPAVHNPEWEEEYCSNECVVSHCRDVYQTYFANNQQNAQSYPAPVK